MKNELKNNENLEKGVYGISICRLVFKKRRRDIKLWQPLTMGSEKGQKCNFFSEWHSCTFRMPIFKNQKKSRSPPFLGETSIWRECKFSIFYTSCKVRQMKYVSRGGPSRKREATNAHDVKSRSCAEHDARYRIILHDCRSIRQQEWEICCVGHDFPQGMRKEIVSPGACVGKFEEAKGKKNWNPWAVIFQSCVYTQGNNDVLPHVHFIPILQMGDEIATDITPDAAGATTIRTEQALKQQQQKSSSFHAPSGIVCVYACIYFLYAHNTAILNPIKRSHHLFHKATWMDWSVFWHDKETNEREELGCVSIVSIYF